MFSMPVLCDTNMLASLIPLCHEIDTSHVPFFTVINDYHPIFPRIFPRIASSITSLSRTFIFSRLHHYVFIDTGSYITWTLASAFLSASDLLLIYQYSLYIGSGPVVRAMSSHVISVHISKVLRWSGVQTSPSATSSLFSSLSSRCRGYPTSSQRNAS